MAPGRGKEIFRRKMRYASGGQLSCADKKVTKESAKGVTRAPARDAVPLCNPPGPSIVFAVFRFRF